MIYDVRQTTTYVYETAVTRARHVLRLLPVTRDLQRVTAAMLDIDPIPISRREATDFFHNWTTVAELEEPHETLTLKLAARISVTAVEPIDPDKSPPWESVRAEAYASENIGPVSPVHFIHPSRQVSLDPEIRDYARASFAPRRPVLAGAVELMHRIKNDFTYELGATTVTTTPSMSFALRRGVCQDFAHIMIAGLRGLGLPAAYVSGFLRTVPRPGAAHLAGADAMHAWIKVWCGAAGWWGLDPTNALIAGEDHVVLAIGRDYADVAPIDGVVLASGEQRLTTAVDVIPVEG
ncbi:MAG TPA: transglutaminase family protein [Xanthobacteraceae bacterium]|nr:transglutaminase family protein [Xanthobacteraceae bacterium]